MPKILLAAFAAVLLVGCSGAPTPSASTPAAASSGASQSTGASTGGALNCVYTPDGTASKPVQPPAASPTTTSGSLDYVIDLDGSAVGITLLASAAPCTVNSFVSLAKQGFYDGTSCHRLGDVPGFQMLQCGDPTATGSGGPGYSFADELHGSETYPAGTIAMANAGPNTNGSQFFLVFGDTTLDPAYTVFGKIDAAGLAVLNKLAAKGSDDSEAKGVGKPKAAAVITSVKPR